MDDNEHNEQEHNIEHVEEDEYACSNIKPNPIATSTKNGQNIETDMTDIMDMQVHNEKLARTCRLCGKLLKKTERTYNAMHFKDELLLNYGIMICNEDQNVFPTIICSVDARKLYRFRREEDHVLKGEILPNFMPHGENCNICGSNVPGRPRNVPPSSLPTVHNSNIFDEDEIQPKLQQNVQKDYKDKIEDHEEKESSNETKSGEARSGTSIHPLDELFNHLLAWFSAMNEEHKKDFFFKLLQLFGSEHLPLLCFCLGKLLISEIKGDINAIYQVYKDVTEMSEFDAFTWIWSRSPHVLSFFLGIGNQNDIKNFEAIRSNSYLTLNIARAIEQTYMICSTHLVAPLSFLLNICIYALTGSKTAVDMVGNCNPAGHYKTVTKWLRDQGTEEPKMPDADVINVFDNEQVVGRKSAIKPGNKVNASIITNTGYVLLNSLPNIQNDAQYMPKSLRINDPQHKKELHELVEKIIDESSEDHKEYMQLHYQQLFRYVTNAIDLVMSEQIIEDGKIKDKIDDKVQERTLEETKIMCMLCGFLNNKRKIICEGCNEKEGIKLSKEKKKKSETHESKPSAPKYVKFVAEEQEDCATEIRLVETLYDHVTSNHTEPHNIVLTDPVYCNPNSLEALALVLRKIGVENKVDRYGGNRKWTIICCDGLPYTIILKLMNEAVVCAEPGCSKKFLQRSKLESHGKEEHNTESCRYVYEFDWFYLRIGAGHYEMNLFKSFFELNWIPFMETVCERMGFTSENAKQYAKSCKDTHKSWNLLLVFHFASLRELVTPYVRKCLTEGKIPDAKDFFKFSEKLYSTDQHPNFGYLMEQVCRFSQGIINLRASVRRNNSKLLKSSKFNTKELFHGRHHPKYQQIEVFDTIQDKMMPDRVRDVNDKYSSITTTHNFSTGEDFDFVLEEKNRQLKAWIPKGIPSDLIWRTVCRNNAVLEKIKGNAMALLGINSSEGKARQLNIEEAIDDIRLLFRRTGYLQKTKYHTSISGMALDEDLVNFVSNSTKKRSMFLKFHVLNSSDELPKAARHPFPITPEERAKQESVEKMTLSEIKDTIENLLEVISDPLQYNYHQLLYKTELKGKKKEHYISFLEQLKESIECCDQPVDQAEQDYLED